MFSEIVKKYDKFSDALISNFLFDASFDTSFKGNIEIIIKCMNYERDYEWDVIKLIFLDVLEFRFIENAKTSSLVINSALLEHKGELIIVDFFPIIFSEINLKENNNSDFIIKCKQIKYNLLVSL